MTRSDSTPAETPLEAVGSTLLTRRSVARTAAWATPLAVTGVAAPAFAASPGCTQFCWFPSLSDTNGNGRVDEVTWYESTDMTVVAPIYAQLAFSGLPGTTGTTGNITDAGRTYQYIELELPGPVAQAQSVQMTLTFLTTSNDALATVRQLNVRVHEIDGIGGGTKPWQDRAVVKPAPTQVVQASQVTALSPPPPGGTVYGANTAANPAVPMWGNFVDLEWAGPLSQVTFALVAGVASNTSQKIRVTLNWFFECK